MSHRLSRGKRRYLAALCSRESWLGSPFVFAPRVCWRGCGAVIDHGGQCTGCSRSKLPGGVKEAFGKRARREGRHYDGQKMSEPCTICRRRMPGNTTWSGSLLLPWCRRCVRCWKVRHAR